MEKRHPSSEWPVLPISLVPTPTKEYRMHRKTLKATVEPGTPVSRIPIPIPVPPRLHRGSRVLIWKQDPTVDEMGIREAFIPGLIVEGPKDSRIETKGIPAVSPNAMGDFIQTPGTDAFDAVHTFSVVRQSLTMYQRSLGAHPVPWQWNSSTNTDPLEVYPHGLSDTMNAFYSRSSKALKFGDFNQPGSSPPHRVYTCRSLDIVSHEAGHAILDGLKPDWLRFDNPPQTGGLHESFGDLTAIFLALSQMDQVEAIIAQTKANLHDKTFLSDLAEEFGLALGRPNGLRNADNDLKLSEVGNEVHAISQVFTGAIYDILADIFTHTRKPFLRDDAAVLYEAGQYLCSLVLRAIDAAPEHAATFADVANKMLFIAGADGKPEYRNFIYRRFEVRQVLESTTEFEKVKEFAPRITDAKGAEQNRVGCCGTMQLSEYLGEEEQLEKEINEFAMKLSEREKGARKKAVGK